MLENLLTPKDALFLHRLIEESSHVAVVCHVSPDGDALGSILAMTAFLERKGKKATPVSPNAFPDFLKWMPGVEKILFYEKNEAKAKELINHADLIIWMDFNASSRIEALANLITTHPAKKIMIDHHLHPSDECDLKISFPEMSSTCELFYRILVQLGEAETITVNEAVCIYTGMMTDTGGFTYNSNRSEIYYIISRLLTKGIDKDKIYRNVYYDYSPSRFQLLGYMLYIKMELLSEYNAVLMTLTREEQRRFSHRKGDTEGFVNIPLQIRATKLSIFMRENTEKDNIRISLRSVDDFPCNKMAAEFFNGGGHLNASGGELTCSMDEAIKIAKSAIRKYAALLTDKK